MEISNPEDNFSNAYQNESILPLLMIACLGPESLDADVKRLYSARDAFTLLDFEDHNNDSIKELLLRCFIHKNFLKLIEGKNLLSYIIATCEVLHPFIVGVIKPQLVSGVKSVANTYGDILLKAWKMTSDAKSSNPEKEDYIISQEIMEDLIQEFLHDAIHASDPKYFKSLRGLLDSFHSNKNSKGVDAMMLKIYDPIIWRSLQCANAIVRAQSCALFLDVFPLNDPKSNTADDESLKQKQFDFIIMLLKDQDHRVRMVVTSGICHVFKEYWGYIPVSALKQILQYLVCTLSHDVSSPAVRASVFTGLGEILLNPLSHEILKTLLPLLANSLHDTSEKVRLAFIKMLIQVKSIETIKFYEIVSEENLLLRFSVDSRKSNITTALTELLFNSYFPIQDKESTTYNPAEEKAEQIRRCLIFIKKQSNAACAFYSKLHLFSSVGTVARFSALLFSYLLDKDSGILLSECSMNDENENENEENNKNRQHPLMLRAKRRRAKEVCKTKNVLNVYDFKLVQGILNVVFDSLESIKSSIGEKVQSFIDEQFTVAKIDHAYELLAVVDVKDTVWLVPKVIKIISLLKSMNCLNSPSQNDLFSPEKIIMNYISIFDSVKLLSDQHHSNDEDKFDDKTCNYFNASATVEMICALEAEEIILSKVNTCLLCYILNPNNSNNFDIESALELFTVLMESQKPLITNRRECLHSNMKNITTISQIFKSTCQYLEKFFNRQLNDSVVVKEYSSEEMIGLKFFHYCFLAFVFYEMKDSESGSISHYLKMALDWITKKVIPILIGQDVSFFDVDTDIASPGSIKKFAGQTNFENHNLINDSPDKNENQSDHKVSIEIAIFNLTMSSLSDATTCDYKSDIYKDYVTIWKNMSSFSKCNDKFKTFFNNFENILNINDIQ